MSTSSSKPTQLSATTFNERLNEQLVNCLQAQTTVIQNLAQYSQHISLQLFEIKTTVEILSNRVAAIQQQYNQQHHYAPNHYPASYYPTHPPPPMIPASHPPAFFHHPGPLPSVPQQGGPLSMPATSAPHQQGNFPFLPTNPISSTLPVSSSTQPFSFGPSAQPQPPNLKINNPATQLPVPTTTTPTKPLISNPPKATVADTNVKPTNLFQPAATNNNPFSFGTLSSAPPHFGSGGLTSGLPASSIVAKPASNPVDDGDDGEGGGEDESYEPNISFKPIIELRAVETKTGEEDETVLFCERAKLYRFDTAANQMKERGIGEMKILQHKEKKVCRILMRREQVLKICANHQIGPHMELKPYQGSANAYLWSAMDFADGESKHETLCVRFKTDDQAKNFANTFNKAKEVNRTKPSDLPAVEKISLKTDTKPKAATNDDDVISIGEIKPSAEQIDRAKQLQLPSTFYLYENKEPCKGCIGCKDDSSAVVPSENKSTGKSDNNAKSDPKQSNSQPSVNLFAPKTPLGSSESLTFSFNNADKNQSQLQKQISTQKSDKLANESATPSSTAATQYDNKPSIFGNFNATQSGSIFGGASQTVNSNGSIFGGSPSTNSTISTNSGFSFGGFGSTPSPTNGFTFLSANANPTSTSTTTSTITTATTAATATDTNAKGAYSVYTFGLKDKPVFGNAPKYSFSDLAKQSPSSNGDKTTSNGTGERVFAGQGALVFGTGSANATTPSHNNEEDDGEGGGEDESYEPNISFKPIVQLKAVETKTGEEDETVLFCERAKLYRFDTAANQMKERGIGEIKILQHKEKNVCRILMRREQVLKICANHQIGPHMELKPHQGSDNAYVWSAMDFADGEAKHETLCIRFKSAEQARRFEKLFNSVKQAGSATSK